MLCTSLLPLRTGKSHCTVAPREAPSALVGTHHFIHSELSTGLGAEELLIARGGSELPDQVSEQQEVVEEEGMQLLIALGLVQLPAVQKLPGAQAVGEGVENKLLKREENGTL